MKPRRTAPLVFVLTALMLVTALVVTVEATPQVDVITIANSAADERDPAADFNPVSNEWHVVHQSGETSFRRDVSANGQTMEAPVSFDPAGGVRNPLVAVAANGLSVYPFYDLRFDPPPPNLLSPSHDIPEGTYGDGSYRWLLANIVAFAGQLPLANGPGLQSPKCITADTNAFGVFYVQRMAAEDPVSLYARLLTGANVSGNPIAVSDGMTDTAHVDCTYLGGYYLAAFLQNANVLIGLLNAQGLIDLGTALDLQADIEDMAVDAFVSTDPFLALVYVLGPEAAHVLAFDLLDEATWGPPTLAAGDATTDAVTIRNVNSPTNPDIACYNGASPRCLIVWQETGTGGQRDIWGVFTTGSNVGAAFPIANTGAEERDPYVAASPNDTFLVLWNEGERPSRDVKAALVTAAPQVTVTPTATPTTAPNGTPGATTTVTPSLFLPLIRK